MKVLVTGASGLVGQTLVPMLQAAGIAVVGLSRNPSATSPFPVYKWNIAEDYIDPQVLEGVNSIIHLAGAPIADARWTKSRKKEIITSRVKSTSLLSDLVKEQGIKLDSFIGASAIGYYGAYTSSHIYTETDKAANDFLGQSCQEWENASVLFETLSQRRVTLRIGVVLAKNGGALQKISAPVKMGLGAALGSGQQYMPWIHLQDLCHLILWSLQNDTLDGVFNAVAPTHITNAVLTKAIAGCLNKKIYLPNVPAFVLKLSLGELANMLLEGSRVSGQKILDQGFSFQYPQIEDALQDLLG